MNLFGYARVSTTDQSTEAQVEKLQAAGCTEIYKENASGGRWDRPELHKLLDRIGDRDVLVVWKLDRLSRSLGDLLHILKKLDDAGAGFRSLTESIDTTTPAGRMMMQMLGAVAEFERAMVKERTKLGLARARAAGRILGARFKLTPAQQKEAVAMVESGRTQTEVAGLFKVDRSTISRLLSERRVLGRKALKPTKTEDLNVFDPETGRRLGTIQADVFRLDRLLNFAGSDGWHAGECLDDREREAFGLAQEDRVRFERA